MEYQPVSPEARRAVSPVFNEGPRKHLNVVVLTSLGTTFSLLIMIAAIAMYPVPHDSSPCFGCCSDSQPCEVLVPHNLTALNISVIDKASSGYSELFGGVVIKHTCYCSTLRSGESPTAAVEDFVFQRTADQQYKDESSFANLLDQDKYTFWCSLPKSVGDIFGAGSPAAKALEVTFPQNVTFLARLEDSYTQTLRGVRLRITESNLCAAREVQLQSSL